MDGDEEGCRDGVEGWMVMRKVGPITTRKIVVVHVWALFFACGRFSWGEGSCFGVWEVFSGMWAVCEARGRFSVE